MSVHFYNPGYEASVATGNKNYTPSRVVQKFRRDLAFLPLYYKAEGDRVLVPEDYPRDFWCEDFVTQLDQSDELAPWGWAPELIGLFGKEKVPYDLGEIYRWTSRQLSVELWHNVRDLVPDYFDDLTPPVVLREYSEDIASSVNRKWVLKGEFSSSGRGVQFYDSSDHLRSALHNRNSRSQTLILEPYYEKLHDRGYEFYRNEQGTIEYLGLSSFWTQEARYIGNRIASPHILEHEAREISTFPSQDDYVKVLTEALSRLPLGKYQGHLGVDTLLFKSPVGNFRLVPCIEMNCRTTMGHLSLALGQFLAPLHLQANFSIINLHAEPLPSTLRTKTPLFLIPKESLTSGHYPLTPIFSNTQFVALLEIL